MRTLLVAALLFVALVPAAVAAPERPMPGPGQPRFPPVWAQHRALAQVLARHAIVSCGGGHGDAVALTFDDGPSPYTSRLLGILRRGGAHATFFDVGNRLAYWPDAAYAEARLGGVGNHTWSHAHLTRLRHWLVWLELMRTQYQVGSQVGWKPRLFRTPYAEHSRATDQVALRLGLVEVFWNVDARDDVKHAHVGAIVQNVERGLRPGAIILLHDLHPWTVGALPKILQAIRVRGLRAVSVQELLAIDPPAPGQRCPYDPAS
ncbi:MAG TPA: polysaccharide deacetylase family protein [Gaiellaceae bacterium]|nr:polysaccharide deacetylase family protein [Gaiellaceae bacterium]